MLPARTRSREVLAELIRIVARGRRRIGHEAEVDRLFVQHLPQRLASLVVLGRAQAHAHGQPPLAGPHAHVHDHEAPGLVGLVVGVLEHLVWGHGAHGQVEAPGCVRARAASQEHEAHHRDGRLREERPRLRHAMPHAGSAPGTEAPEAQRAAQALFEPIHGRARGALPRPLELRRALRQEDYRDEKEQCALVLHQCQVAEQEQGLVLALGARREQPLHEAFHPATGPRQHPREVHAGGRGDRLDGAGDHWVVVPQQLREHGEGPVRLLLLGRL
mmetsp:Transcript_31326/g.88254  ORF Transcript_31326/g.88254 Transcript_31326/m.88254 type:complete len:274 (-) Transcript_31326:122-943(-)